MFQVVLKVLAFISENSEVIGAGALVIYELIFRKVPTEKDYSVINAIKKIIDLLVSNKKVNGGFH